MRDVFRACGEAGVLGGLLVFWLVRSEAPGAAQRPAAAVPELQAERVTR